MVVVGGGMARGWSDTSTHVLLGGTVMVISSC